MESPLKLDFPLASTPRQRMVFAILELRGPHVLLAGLVRAAQPQSLELLILKCVEDNEAVARFSCKQRFGTLLMNAEGRCVRVRFSYVRVHVVRAEHIREQQKDGQYLPLYMCIHVDSIGLMSMLAF